MGDRRQWARGSNTPHATPPVLLYVYIAIYVWVPEFYDILFCCQRYKMCRHTHTLTHTEQYTHSYISKGTAGGEKRGGGYYVPMPVALNTL